ncbi:MAG TPA: hypothetical protein PKD61_26615, partial [Polyangiaceae bacterium]|nr:hypothetical protein [Polyangiaceae bacterium]
MTWSLDRIVWPVLPWRELAQRYREGASDLSFEISVALVLGLVLSLPLLMPRPRAYRWLGVVVAALSVAFGVWRGWEFLWIGDDAFISFRYAENFAHGHGLVFNPGERVEGYTNFLWTVLIGIGIWLGQDPLMLSAVLSLGSFAGVIVLSQELVRRLAPWNAPVSAAFVAPVLAGSYVLTTFATSGLETMFGALLVLLMLWFALLRRPALAGTFGTLAAMTHPDHGIFYAVLGLCLALDRERRRQILRYAVPFVVIYVPYFLWRYNYYGDLFPNTYYAKSGGLEYFRQGWIYVAVSGFAAGLIGALPLAVFGALARHSHFLARFFLIATPLFSIYVAKIGGDFLLGRLFVPIIPVVLILAE